MALSKASRNASTGYSSSRMRLRPTTRIGWRVFGSMVNDNFFHRQTDNRHRKISIAATQVDEGDGTVNHGGHWTADVFMVVGIPIRLCTAIRIRPSSSVRLRQPDWSPRAASVAPSRIRRLFRGSSPWGGFEAGSLQAALVLEEGRKVLVTRDALEMLVIKAIRFEMCPW